VRQMRRSCQPFSFVPRMRCSKSAKHEWCTADPGPFQRRYS
jgi:hypothetical protein